MRGRDRDRFDSRNFASFWSAAAIRCCRSAIRPVRNSTTDRAAEFRPARLCAAEHFVQNVGRKPSGRTRTPRARARLHPAPRILARPARLRRARRRTRRQALGRPAPTHRASRSRASFSRTRRSWCSMKRLRRSTPKPKPASRNSSTASCAAARRSPSLTGSRRLRGLLQCDDVNRLVNEFRREAPIRRG